MPRVAARLDVPQVSEIIAGNFAGYFPPADSMPAMRSETGAGAGRQEGVITVRTSEGSGWWRAAGSASVESVNAQLPIQLALWAKSCRTQERPELGLRPRSSFPAESRASDRAREFPTSWRNSRTNYCCRDRASRAAVDAGFVPPTTIRWDRTVWKDRGARSLH